MRKVRPDPARAESPREAGLPPCAVGSSPVILSFRWLRARCSEIVGGKRVVRSSTIQALQPAASATKRIGSKSTIPTLSITRTPHDLRHTAASLAISSGANVKAVQRMLGHASAAMTLDVYADLFDDDLIALADGLDDAARAADVFDLWGSAAS
jgi:integrase